MARSDFPKGKEYDNVYKQFEIWRKQNGFDSVCFPSPRNGAIMPDSVCTRKRQQFINSITQKTTTETRIDAKQTNRRLQEAAKMEEEYNSRVLAQNSAAEQNKMYLIFGVLAIILFTLKKKK